MVSFSEKIKQVFEKRPYGLDTVFGYTALLDSEDEFKSSIIHDDEIKINEGKNIVMSMLLNGQFYSHTGKNEIKLSPHLIKAMIKHLCLHKIL